jgi:protein SCO1/2
MTVQTMSARAFAVLALALLVASCAPPRGPVTDITGVMLYFGYTHCPDECPTTLANLASVLTRLGAKASDVRVLFVSVDPDRDTLPVLKTYVQVFAPEIDGLRGSADATAMLARRYRVTYQVTPAGPDHPYDVMHSDSIFFFDAKGRARLVATSVNHTDVIEADIQKLMN